ncbi:MAG: glycosyltransferase family 2 protein [Proteobacteria bacterium]|nr:glycosyltransferase family 2 protein [Pseudomonadota bacterium]
MLSPEVTLCIPAWQSEQFIEETLGYAQRQSYPNLRILVSVDQCDDNTALICQRIADSDPRVKVLVQEKRLGWAGNVNFLLQQVRSPLFALYWHDDIIGPRWVEILARAMIGNSQVVAAYGSTRHFGSHDYHDLSGRPLLGQTAERLIEVLINPELLGLTRCMIRKEIIDLGLTIPQLDGRDYFENNHPYWLQILASGQILYIPEAEYNRRNGIGSSVVDGWLRLPQSQVLLDMRKNVSDCMQIITDSISDPTELVAVTYCLYLFILRRLRLFELNHNQASSPIEMSELSEAFKELQQIELVDQFDQQQLRGVTEALSDIFFLEGKYWQAAKAWNKALAKFTAAMAIQNHTNNCSTEIADCLLNLDYTEESRAITAQHKSFGNEP